MLKELSKHDLSILKRELTLNKMLLPDGIRVYYDETHEIYKAQFLKKDGLKARQMDVDLLTKEDVDDLAVERQLKMYFMSPMSKPLGTDTVEVKVGSGECK